MGDIFKKKIFIITAVLFFNELFAEVNRLLAAGRAFHYWAIEPLINLLSWNKPAAIAGAGVLGSAWKHEAICLKGPSGFPLQGSLEIRSGSITSQISLGNKAFCVRFCSSVMNGLWNQARWVRVLGLGQTWEYHNQLKLAGKLSSLECNCLGLAVASVFLGFFFLQKSGAEHYPGVYISNVLSRL